MFSITNRAKRRPDYLIGQLGRVLGPKADKAPKMSKMLLKKILRSPIKIKFQVPIFK